MPFRLALAITAGVLLAGPAAAAEKKPAQLRDFPFWSAPKQPHAKRVADILTADQKKLIEKVNDAYAKALPEAADEFQPQIEAAKGNAEETAKPRAMQREAVVAAFEKRLDQILSADQREAVKKAGEEARKWEEKAKKTPKPGK